MPRSAPGLRALATPGHAPGHMSFLVELPRSGRWLFAFDAVPTTENVERDAPIALSSLPGQEERIRASQQRLLELARAEGARLQPGHCPQTWPQLAAPPASYD